MLFCIESEPTRENLLTADRLVRVCEQRRPFGKENDCVECGKSNYTRAKRHQAHTHTHEPHRETVIGKGHENKFPWATLSSGPISKNNRVRRTKQQILVTVSISSKTLISLNVKLVIILHTNTIKRKWNKIYIKNRNKSDCFWIKHRLSDWMKGLLNIEPIPISFLFAWP